MKLVVLFLVAVCCCSLGSAGASEWNKLKEVLAQLAGVRKTLKQNDRTMLNSPPHDVEDCCYLSALKCFHENLQRHFNGTGRIQRKLNKSLNNTLTKSGVAYCPSGDNTATICTDCHSQPKVTVQVFYDRLESLIEKAVTRLAGNRETEEQRRPTLH